MGQEIVYCARCQKQLRGPDFEKGTALRLESQAYCRECVPTPSSPIPAARSEESTSRRSVPTRRTTVRREASGRRASPWVFVGAAAGGAVLLILAIAVAVSGPSPAPEPPPPPPGPPAALEKPPPRPAPPAEKPAREQLAEIDAQVAEYVRKGEHASAIMVLEAAAKRHANAAWAAEIGRRIRDVSQELEKAKAAARAAAPPPAGLVGHWTFDEIEGASLRDLSPHGNHATLVRSPDQVPGRLGKALAFGSDRREFVRVPDSPSLSLTGPFTVAAWVKPAAWTGPAQRAVVEKWESSPGASRGYLLRMNVERRVRCLVADESGDVGPTGATALPADAWTHIAGVYDGSSVRVYVNGRLDGSRRVSRVPADGASPLTIGCAPPEGNRFEGAIDDVRIYSRALSDAEISELAGR